VPHIIGDEVKTLDAAEKLKNQGILVAAIRPPTVPNGTARLRISLSAKHSEADLEKLSRFLQHLK
jgi:8-amino-7-oxononanoate synthase